MTIYAELIKFAHMNNRVSPLCYQYRERQKNFVFQLWIYRASIPCTTNIAINMDKQYFLSNNDHTTSILDLFYISEEADF